MVLAALVATITVAAAGDKVRVHPHAVQHSVHHAGYHRSGRTYGSYDSTYFDDTDEEPCTPPPIVQVSDKPLPNVLANVFVQVVAAETCGGGDVSPEDVPSPARTVSCHHRIGAPDDTAELDQRFVSFEKWRAENPNTGAPVVPIAAISPSYQIRENFGASSEPEPPGRWDIAIVESDDDQQDDQAQLMWCQTAER